MRRSFERLLNAGCRIAAAVLVACSELDEREAQDAGADTIADGQSPGDASPTFAPTLSAVYREVFVPHGCLLGLCHGEGASGGGLQLFPRDRVRERLVAPSNGNACRDLGLLVVEPGDETRSLLWIKLQSDPPCGVQMPPDDLVDSRHLDQVRGWIEKGAPND